MVRFLIPYCSFVLKKDESLHNKIIFVHDNFED